MKTLVKENKRTARIGSSAARAPNLREYDAYTYPPGALDRYVTQKENADSTKQEE